MTLAQPFVKEVVDILNEDCYYVKKQSEEIVKTVLPVSVLFHLPRIKN